MLRKTVFNERLLAHLRLWTYKFTKRRFSMLSLAAIMIIGTFAFANNLFFPTAKATYVEGAITQDTIWTLVDSPFVVSKNVTVYSGANLTIERGVEVRFGGNFSLNVEGRLIANGTQDRMINFTSNKYQPQTGDWNTIEFSGAQPSLLAYCSIEYAKTGITTENSSVTIRNSMISNNYHYGISIAHSTAQIQANEIANNSLSGVYVSGNNQVTIQDNTIKSNLDGILLDGNTSSGINISRNIVLSNNQSGIHLDAAAYSSLTILYNNVSANEKGFYISGNASTQITNNSISFNNVGFLYAAGQGHQAHWNDIYRNVVGMDASYPTDKSVEVVNATYNYWGNKSGPYHISLNPGGTGNPVRGDGVNIYFIFFLTAPIGYINQRPVARLLADKIHVSPGQQVTFFATNSTDDRRVDQYFFDFGDKQNSSWTTLSVFVHKYSLVGTYSATVKVMDDFGVISNNLASLQIACQILPPLTVSLTPNNSGVSSGEQVSVTIHVTNATSSVDNANATLFSILDGSLLTSSGLTNSSGYFTTTFSAPNVALITNIRIVASASKTGFVDGSDYEYLSIQPPLRVDVATNPGSILSEATASVSVRVTYSGAPVSAAFVTVSSNSTGSFSFSSGLTNSSGYFTTTFSAPNVALITNIRIVASASKTGFVDGSDYEYLSIQPPLRVDVATNPGSILSEATASVSVRVTYSGAPVSAAFVTVSSNSTGSFYQTIGVTGANGTCAFVFTAPQTSTQLEIDIVATATRKGYLGGQGQALLAITPKVLLVQVMPSSAGFNSETSSNITARVVYDANPVSNATVVLSSDNGRISPTNRTTDANGECIFTFTPPQVTTRTNFAINATATKVGYAQGTSQTLITVNLGRLDVQVSAYPVGIDSRATSQVTVHVTYDGQPVANATVNVSSGSGAFAVATRTSDNNGDCVFTFAAPETSTEFSLAITAKAMEVGYLDGQGQTSITVRPGGSLLSSSLVIIAIVAVILMIAIVLILIKLKVIVISQKGE